MLDLNKVLAELRQERQLIEDAIARLERLFTARQALERRPPGTKMATIRKDHARSAGTET